MGRFPEQEDLLMHRFYADPSRSEGDLICLSPEDARHALTVLRLKTGQKIEIIHRSALWEAEIVSVESQDIRTKPIRPLPSSESRIKITLFQGLPKSDKMDWIVQKATELGVSSIVPLVMERSVVRFSPEKDLHKADRWRKIIREACKQSGRCIIPELHDPCSLRQLLDSFALPELNVVPWEEARMYGPRSFCQDHATPASLGILIGPEGGISQEEMGLLRAAGFVPVTLGKRILRTETAGLAAVSAFLSLYGEMDS